ncbi:MAG: prolyl oligopeptidase family serine peptidase, partial [Actinobacteria bacterium]|nr:prolyl oligopeptidase family serine peptidase [Actinomycetota bacterium]
MISAIDGGGDECIVTRERDVVRIHRRELTRGVVLLHRLDPGAHDALGERGPIDLAHAPGRTEVGPEGRGRREGQCVVGDPMDLDVVRMPIATEVVVRDDHLRAYLSDDLDERKRGLEQIGAPEAPGLVVARRADHAGVAEPSGTAEEPPVGDTEGAHRACELGLAVVAEGILLIGREVGELLEEHLALLAQGAGDKRDLRTLARVLGHGRAGADRFVVGVGVHEEESSIHPPKVPCRVRCGTMLSMSSTDTFPRQKARTRGFQLGRPRGFAVAGTQVFFIRSASGQDSAGNLWIVNTVTGEERLLVDSSGLLTGGDLPPEERARRERMREVTSGITAFSLDESGRTAAFVVSGVPYVVDVISGITTELPAPGPVIDPRMSPDGTHVAFVSSNGLHVVRIGAEVSTPLCEPTHSDEAWGLADFVAAEELDRYRGHWWHAGGLLVEHYDNSGVAVRWIGDPARPEVEPVAHRYPAAGTDNAVVTLWFVTLDGARSRLEWDNEGFPYLASVHDGVVMLLSRDQRTAQVARVDAEGLTLEILATRTDDAWVDAVAGVPLLDVSGALVDIVNDTATDTYRVTRNGAPVTPPGLQVRDVLRADASSCVVTASSVPEEQRVYTVDYSTGEVTPLTPSGRWSTAVAGDGVRVEIATDPSEPAATFTIIAGDRRIPVESLAERPLIRVSPNYATVGDRELRTCVLWPDSHNPGDGPLPVILSPYGGPHAQRVVRSAGAYATDQWIADQGFAVVIADGRGTPGRGPAWERSILGDLATRVLEDQVDALHALAEDEPDLDLTRVGIRGWSFGGYLAALAVLDRPD